MIENFINDLYQNQPYPPPYQPYPPQYQPYNKHYSNSTSNTNTAIIITFSIYLFIDIILAYYVYKDTHSVSKTILAFLFGLVIMPFVFAYSYFDTTYYYRNRRAGRSIIYFI